MNKQLFYAYGIIFILLLNFIASIADDLLFSLLRFFNLTGNTYIKAYLLLISIILVIVSGLLSFSCKGQQIMDRSVLLRILIAGIIGVIGSIWLVMVFTAHNL
jgi:hypothetical protein